MTVLTDSDLYLRGAETLLASWQAVAHGSRGAAVLRSGGVTAGVFPHGPERAIYNKALLERDLGPVERVDAVDLMEAAYASAAVDRFAAWTRERRGHARRARGPRLHPRHVDPGDGHGAQRHPHRAAADRDHPARRRQSPTSRRWGSRPACWRASTRAPSAFQFEDDNVIGELVEAFWTLADATASPIDGSRLVCGG